MGVPGYLVASSVIGVLAQRLVRIICKRCKQKYMPSDGTLAELGITPEEAKNSDFARGKGCNYCQKKGYKGRLGIYELMNISPRIRELIFENAATQDIRKLGMEEGMHTLFNDGVIKARKGITTLEEIYRIAKKTEQDQIGV
jgi:type IV pilus assembly protein PilB